MVYKGILFDLDGTLIHTSMDYVKTSLGRTLKNFGIETTDDMIKTLWFDTRRDEIVRNEFKIKPDDFWDYYRKHEDSSVRLEHLKAYEDVDLLEKLKEYNYKIGIVTGTSKTNAEIKLKLIGRSYFDEVICAREKYGIRPKPDSHGIEECLRKLRIKKDQALYVGNGDEDIKAAKSAGILDVQIDRGEYEFKNSRPSVIISSLYDLKQLIGLNGI